MVATTTRCIVIIPQWNEGLIMTTVKGIWRCGWNVMDLASSARAWRSAKQVTSWRGLAPFTAARHACAKAEGLQQIKIVL